MAIASRARALAIIEQTAAWHQTPIAHMQASGRRRDQARPARAEAAHRLKEELGWSLRMIGAELGCNPESVRQLQQFYVANEPDIRRRRADLTALHQASSDALRERVVYLEEQHAMLREDMMRLTGVTLYERLMVDLTLDKPRLGLVLGALVAAYPRYLRWDALVSAYDHACEEIGYGGRRAAGPTWEGATFETVKVSLQLLGRIFAERGWPAPVEFGPIEESRRLTNECADFLNAMLGGEVAAGRAAYLEQQERLQRVRAAYAKTA